MNQFELKSPAFTDGGALPKKYTIDGEKVSPPLEWANAPEGTRSLVLVMTDSDAPLQMFPGVIVHWVQAAENHLCRLWHVGLCLLLRPAVATR